MQADSNLAVLAACRSKAESFFGPWLVEYELSFSDSLLIDDRTDNCHAFTRAGGAAVHWKIGTGDTGEVARSIDNWLLTSIPH